MLKFAKDEDEDEILTKSVECRSKEKDSERERISSNRLKREDSNKLKRERFL